MLLVDAAKPIFCRQTVLKLNPKDFSLDGLKKKTKEKNHYI
jgi:hypothetical protein